MMPYPKLLFTWEPSAMAREKWREHCKAREQNRFGLLAEIPWL
jgi:hypothetical protein